MLFPRAVLAALFVFSMAAQSAPKAAPKAPAKASSKPAAKSALDKATLEEYARHLLLWNKDIAVTVSDPVPAPMPGFKEVRVTGTYKQASLDEIFYVSDNGQKIVRGSIYDIAKNPFEGELNKITTDLQPSLGTPGARVLVVVFSDFQCGYCKDEAKVLRDNLIQSFPKDVRLYFKDFPIDAIHPWARTAAVAGRCVFRQNPLKFWEYHDWIFEKQQEVTPENLKQMVTDWTKAKGLDMMQFNRCYDTRATEPEVAKNIAEAKALRVQSTPTLFVNGRVIPGSIPWANLKQIIQMELDHAVKTNFEPEKCCAITLPSPLKQ